MNRFSVYGDESGTFDHRFQSIAIVSGEEHVINELNIKLDIPLNVEAVVGSLPFAADFPFRLAREEIKVMGFRLGDYDGGEFPVFGIAGLLNRHHLR